MNKLLLLVLFLAATAVFAAEENTGEWATTTTAYLAASSVNTATPQWAFLWGKQKDDTYYVNDLLVLVVGFDRDVSSESLCKPTIDIKFDTNPRDRYTSQTRNAVRMTNAEVTSLMGAGYTAKTFDKPFLAFAYRIKDGDNAKEVKSYSIRSETGASTGLCSWTVASNDQTIETTGVKVDTRPARLIQVTQRNPVSTVFTARDVIEISLVFDRNVILESSPLAQDVKLRLNSGGWAKFAGYDKNSIIRTSYDTLVFQYIVQNGDYTLVDKPLDLEYVNGDAGIVLNNNIIVTAASMLPVVLQQLNPTGFTSIGSLTNEKIHILRKGLKFPPRFYDQSAYPVAVASSEHNVMQTQAFSTENPAMPSYTHGIAAPATPVRVSFEVRVDNVVNVDNKKDSYEADLTLTYSWNDKTFVKTLCKDTTGATQLARYTTDCQDESFEVEVPIEDIGKIWNPMIVPHNSAQSLTTINRDQRVIVQNNGKVTVVQRVLGKFHSPLNIRDYPYDGAILKFQFRSALDVNRVVLENAADSSTQEKVIRDMKDAVFHFIKYSASTDSSTGYSIHTTQITAKRRAFQTNMVVVFPIVFILGVVFCAFFLPVRAESRLITLGVSAVSTLIINYSLQHNAQGANYVSRLAILIMFNYIHILYSFLWFVFIRKIQQGLDEYIFKVQNHKASGETHKPEPSTVAFCIKIDSENFVDRVRLVHTLNVVAGVTYFCFAVVSTAVILAVKVKGG